MGQPRFGNFFTATLYHRVKNSHEYDTEHPVTFECRTASEKELEHFYPLRGLNVHKTGLTLYTQHDILDVIEDDDKLVFMGQEYLIDSVGIYLSQSRMVNQRMFNDSHVIENSPKGIRIY